MPLLCQSMACRVEKKYRAAESTQNTAHPARTPFGPAARHVHRPVAEARDGVGRLALSKGQAAPRPVLRPCGQLGALARASADARVRSRSATAAKSMPVLQGDLGNFV